jgi:hypothetical protein
MVKTKEIISQEQGCYGLLAGAESIVVGWGDGNSLDAKQNPIYGFNNHMCTSYQVACAQRTSVWGIWYWHVDQRGPSYY